MLRKKELLKNIFFLLHKMKFPNFRKKKIDSVVFVRTGGIGDFILFLDAASRINNTIDINMKKILICSEACEQLAELVGFWNIIIPFDKKKYVFDNHYRKRKNFEISKISAEDLYNFEYSRSMATEIIIGLIDAKRRYGFDSQGFLTKYIYRSSNKKYINLISDIDIKMFELEKNSLFVNRILGQSKHAQLFDLKKYFEKKSESIDFFVVIPGASRLERAWPVDRFSQLIKNTINKTGLTCLLLGCETEKDLGNYIVNDLGDEKINNQIGKTSLLQMMKYILNAKFLIGNDSSGAHIAAACNTPAFLFAGDWEFDRFLPYKSLYLSEKENQLVLKKKMRCSGCAMRSYIGSDCDILCGKSSHQTYQCILEISLEYAQEVLNKWLDGLFIDKRNGEEKSGES